MPQANETYRRRIAVTGGAGFIGSNLLLYLVPAWSDCLFVNIDVLTYAGNLTNLAAIENRPNYCFERVDINDLPTLTRCFNKYGFDAIIHLAAESHVDRSILSPSEFISTNVCGTQNLLDLVRGQGKSGRLVRMVHVSTDEVFGEAKKDEVFTPDSPYRPSSPYAASKAAADHLVRSYFRTYDLDLIITNCSNNFGPWQFPEKLIPLVIRNAAAGIEIPIYGDGKQVRDWLHVEDHCRALGDILQKGEAGHTYLIGARNRWPNIDIVKQICSLINQRLGGQPREELITFIEDRPGHDRRYALDPTATESELGWKAEHSFKSALERTIDWYLANNEWIDQCISGDYRVYYDRNYADRKVME